VATALDTGPDREPTVVSDDGDDGGTVLPWWRNPINLIVIVIAAALISGALGYAIGTRHGDVHGNSVDVGFLQDMRYHHENAVIIASTYLTTETADETGAPSSATLRLIATEILLGQQQETGRMIQLLRLMGAAEAADLDGPAMVWMNEPTPYERMPGIATDEQIDEMGQLSGPAADELFASLMIAHHEAGIHMAQHALDHGSNDEVHDFAQAMITGQQSEISELQAFATP
jgi:uncharacterized protein (DUF305 family)